MILIDTNILLYAVNRDAESCRAACRALESAVNDGSPWALSWSVVYEFLRVSTHPKVFSSPLSCEEAWRFIVELIEQPACLMLNETLVHRETFSLCLSEIPRIRGNVVHDFHLAVLMREHGVVDVMTEDRDFLMFPWLDVKLLVDV